MPTRKSTASDDHLPSTISDQADLSTLSIPTAMMNGQDNDLSMLSTHSTSTTPARPASASTPTAPTSKTSKSSSSKAKDKAPIAATDSADPDHKDTPNSKEKEKDSLGIDVSFPPFPQVDHLSSFSCHHPTMPPLTPTQDLLLPRTLLSRLARGVLPPNTSISKDALLALTKASSVFISHLASTADSLTTKKTISPSDVITALEEIEWSNLRGRCEGELKIWEEVTRGKRKGYRERVKARESGVSIVGDITSTSIGEGENAEEHNDHTHREEEEAEGQRPEKRPRVEPNHTSISPSHPSSSTKQQRIKQIFQSSSSSTKPTNGTTPTTTSGVVDEDQTEPEEDEEEEEEEEEEEVDAESSSAEEEDEEEEVNGDPEEDGGTDQYGPEDQLRRDILYGEEGNGDEDESD